MTDRTLVVMPSGLPEAAGKPWKLALRSHDLGGTDYSTVALLDDSLAREVVEAGHVGWLRGEPDWNERHKKRELERARVLQEQAREIIARYLPTNSFVHDPGEGT